MTAKKKPLGNNLSSLLEMDTLSLSLDKLVGSSSSTSTSQPKVLSLPTEIPLDVIAEDLGVTSPEDSIENFINQYSTPCYSSLDDLLTSSTSTSTLSSYCSPSKKVDKKHLFEGLDDLFD